MGNTSSHFTVAVEIASGLLRTVGADSSGTRERIRLELAHLLEELKRSGSFDIQGRELDGSGEGPEVVRIFVSGRQRRFPSTTAREALAYTEGAPSVPVDAASFWECVRAHEMPPAKVAELVGLIVRGAVSERPDILPIWEDDRGTATSSHRMAEGTRATMDFKGSAARWPTVGRVDVAPSVQVLVHPGYLRELTVDKKDDVFTFLREGIFAELGLPLPAFDIRGDSGLHDRGFAFKFNGIRSVPRVGLARSDILVNDTNESLAHQNIDGTATTNPASRQPNTIVALKHEEALQAGGRTTWGPLGYLVLCLAAAIRDKAAMLLSADTVSELLNRLGLAFPVLERAARTRIPPDVLLHVLRELLLDRVSVRNLRRIIELLLRYETELLDDPPHALNCVRAGLSDAISFDASNGTSTVVAYLLDPELEKSLLSSQENEGKYESLTGQILLAFHDELSHLPPTARTPVVLTRSEVRVPLREVLRQELPHLMVLSYLDLPAAHNVQPIARILATR